MNQTTPDHVLDISAHLRITPDRLSSLHSEFSWMRCLGHQIHDFSEFEFLNSQKTVNGHINGKILQIVSQLVGPQEGLSISTLCVEKFVLQVTHVVTDVPLGVRLNRDTTFYQFCPKWWVLGSEIGFRLNINKQIDIHQFLINFLHVWRWWQIISWRSYFIVCFFTIIYFIVTFIYQMGNLCKITIISLTVFVQLGPSVFSRKSVYQHRKHMYVSFNDVLSKDFESYLLEDPREWLLDNTGVTYVSSNRKNHLHSYEVGVQMIFLYFKILNHSRQIENSNFRDSNGLLLLIYTWKTGNNVRIRLEMYSITCFCTYSVCDHHIWSWRGPIST